MHLYTNKEKKRIILIFQVKKCVCLLLSLKLQKFKGWACQGGSWVKILASFSDCNHLLVENFSGPSVNIISLNGPTHTCRCVISIPITNPIYLKLLNK